MSSKDQASTNENHPQYKPFYSTPLAFSDYVLGKKVDPEKVPVRLPCGKVILAWRNLHNDNNNQSYAPWALSSDLQHPSKAVEHHKITLETYRHQ